MKRYFFICILLITSSVSVAYASDASVSTGFIPGQIWYSKDPFIEGDTVNVYTALWNGDKSAISAHVEFYDGKTLLGARDTIVAPSEIKDVSVSWKVTAGDHSISAKISSLTITNDGKKEQLTLENNTTTEDKTFVSAKGANTDAIKDGIAKATQAVKDISVPAPITNSVSSVDAFRTNTYASIADTKEQTQNRIDKLSGVTKTTITPDTTKDIAKSKTTTKTVVKVEETKAKPADATEKPIAYVKLFFFTILAFIFGNKIVFYGLILLVIFLILRFIYRKIRRK